MDNKINKAPIVNNIDQKSSYTMNFASDNNNENDSNNGSNPSNAPHKNKGYISVIITAICFILIIVLMLYFFVFRNSTPTRTFSTSDIKYTLVEKDDSGNITEVQPSKDYFTSNPVPGNLNDIVSKDNKGELAKYLLEPKEQLGTYKGKIITRDTTMRVVVSYNSSQIYYLTGSFNYVDAQKGKNDDGTIKAYTTYNYQANITADDYNTYVANIVKYTKVDGNNYYVGNYSPAISPETKSDYSWVFSLIISAVGLIILIYFMVRLSRSMSGSSGPMTGFVNNIARKESGSKVRFADVAGCDEAKAELVEMVDYFHNTDKYTRLGAKLPHGVLLVGPPGTGKTLLAKAVAGEAGVPFFSISGSDFVEMYVGVGASRVRSLFKTAKANAPCLIFIDEIDAVGRQRGAGLGGGNDEREQTLNELLVNMDGFEDNSGIIVMAATNRSDVLDPALTRPGRFDRTITVDLPDRQGRAAILKVHSRNKKLASEVNFDSIAGRTVGFSGADLANIMNEAAILAVRANRSVITTSDIDEAIDRAIAGPAKKSHLEPNEKKQVAYHEAGHAVIGIFLPYSDVVQKITIIPRGRTGGHVLMTPAQDHFLLTKNQMLARITGYLGGRTSEEIFFGDVSTGASNDIEVATNLARSMVTQYGMSELGPVQYEKPGGSVFLGRDYNSTQANYSTQIAFEIDKAVRKIIDDCHEQARKLLTEHSEDVKLIAETLIKYETITSDQIEYLLKNRHLPPVDEHILANKVGLEPKNPNNIVLYAGYDSFYNSIDNILKGNPSRIVITVASKDAHAIRSDDEFIAICKNGAKDPSRIGMMFIDFTQTAHISLTVETFASHLESYANVPVLLVKTDESTVLRLRKRFTPSESIKTENPLPSKEEDDKKESK